jgi:hypothetical protein
MTWRNSNGDSPALSVKIKLDTCLTISWKTARQTFSLEGHWKVKRHTNGESECTGYIAYLLWLVARFFRYKPA